MNKKKITSILIFMLWVVYKGNILFAQDTLITKHPIEVKATNRDGKVLKFKKIIKASNAEELPEAAKHFRRAQVFDIVGKTFGFPGAFIVGYSLGSGLSSPNGLNHQTLVIGLGLIGIEYTIYATLRDPQMKKGIRKYNEAVYKKRQSIEE